MGRAVLLGVVLLQIVGVSLATEVTVRPEVVADLPHLVDEIMVRWDVPGVAVAVVRAESVVFVGGFGVRDLESREKVDADTIFAIGSATKAFTAVAVATLVDEGLVDWDQPLRTYLPDFSLRDPNATMHVTTRDLLAHRTGLLRHDAMWYRSGASRDELYSRLRYLEPLSGLRERFTYSNLMYLVAGKLVEEVSGKAWEEVVAERIFEPLDMGRSTFGAPLAGDGNTAMPHVRSSDGRVAEVPFYEGWAVGPAGSIYSTVNDLAAWLRFQLGGPFDRRVIASETLRETQRPHMVVDRPATQAFPMTNYGLGWFIQPYRGHLFLWHTGSIDGYFALVGFLPGDDLGIAVLSNRSEHRVPEVVTRWVIDRFLGLGEIDWHSRLLEQEQAMDAEADAARAQALEASASGGGPPLPVEAYAGRYSHPAYGELEVRAEEGVLRGGYHGITGRLFHHAADVFIFEATSEIFKDIFQLSFRRDASGRIVSVSSPLAKGVAPVVFLRVAEPGDGVPSPPSNGS